MNFNSQDTMQEMMCPDPMDDMKGFCEDISKFTEEIFLQCFNVMHGNDLQGKRYEEVFTLAVDKNETVKAVIDEIEWEFNAFKRIKTKCNGTFDSIKESTKEMRTSIAPVSQVNSRPKCKVPPNSQIKFVMENCYKTMLETRSDWLGILALYIKFDTDGLDDVDQNEDRCYIIRMIRELMTESTERLSDKAIQEGHLDMTAMSDELATFYAALPEDMFREVQPEAPKMMAKNRTAAKEIFKKPANRTSQKEPTQMRNKKSAEASTVKKP